MVQEAAAAKSGGFTRGSAVEEVFRDRTLGPYAGLLFPPEGFRSGRTLGSLQLLWYSEIDPDATVEIVNTLKSRAAAGEPVFLPLYSEEEIRRDPAKRGTSLVFFKGRPGAPFALCCAGGGFAYVGAMHDSFPHALELSKRGFNAFAIIYRPDARRAMEDLARALSVIFSRAKELKVDTRGYSLWGGSAGARMAAWTGTYGAAAFGGPQLPRPAAVIMQYTGLSGDVDGRTPPTYANVGDEDAIADWRVMRLRIESIRALGIPAVLRVYRGLRHGFGLGRGTAAEGWIDEAAAFWEQQRKTARS